jgi:SAM-dependent methyltransferase
VPPGALLVAPANHRQMQQQIYEDIYRFELTHWWFRGRRHVIASMLRRFSPSRRPLKVADVGCGMGSTFDMLSEFGWVVGIDASPTALAFSKDRGHPLLVAGGLPVLPFPDGVFDIVCALDVIEHLDDDYAAVRELWRICKPGGLLMITVPAYQWLWSEHDDINEHRRRYTRPRLRAALGQAPVDCLKLSYINTFLAPPVMLVRLVKRLFRKPEKDPSTLKSDVYPVPKAANKILQAVFASEATWLRYGSLPFGISVLCVARKPVASENGKHVRPEAID